mmetsp:Transcript_990/g.2002  ORF Transcript_990/g.2002 Transcript_990/m.2002 type:complete len:264 (-) Transcript_990:946-1737(-)
MLLPWSSISVSETAWPNCFVIPVTFGSPILGSIGKVSTQGNTSALVFLEQFKYSGVDLFLWKNSSSGLRSRCLSKSWFTRRGRLRCWLRCWLGSGSWSRGGGLCLRFLFLDLLECLFILLRSFSGSLGLFFRCASLGFVSSCFLFCLILIGGSLSFSDLGCLLLVCGLLGFSSCCLLLGFQLLCFGTFTSIFGLLLSLLQGLGFGFFRLQLLCCLLFSFKCSFFLLGCFLCCGFVLLHNGLGGLLFSFSLHSSLLLSFHFGFE